LYDAHGALGLFPDDEVAARDCGLGCRYVKATAEGDLFNPEHEDKLDQKDRERGGQRFRFQKCGAECFARYTRFLRTRQRVDYTVAQREFINGK
jgi:hypothetical protein